MVHDLSNEEAIFQAALALEAADQRSAYLDGACAHEPDLRRRVEALLRRCAESQGPLDRGAAMLVATAADTMAERPGTVIGAYKLLEQIGEGGMGLVYVAEQQQPVRRKVALKVIKPGMDTRQVIARFEAERQALALMDHPNIARVHDGGATASGRPYFVMELVKGAPITDYCDQNHLTPRERLELFLSVCSAVQHAHQKGIIHRDLKPSNVLVTLHDVTAVVKVIDFGIAKALGQELTDKTLFTDFAQMVGTPLYMSPEQAGMSGLDIDTRSDIYSLGALLYELLTGTTPFDKERVGAVGYDELRRIIREEEPPRPSTRISTLGVAVTTAATQRKSDPRQLRRLFRGELDWIVMKCLEKDRDRRYETANGLGRDIERYLRDEPVQACPPSAAYRLRKLLRRNRGAVLLGSVVLIALVSGIIGLIVSALMIAQQRNLAEQRGQDADNERRAALQAEKRANLERDKAEAINQFLVQNMLTFAGPGRFGHRHGETTLAEVLEEASRNVETSFAGQPELQASIRLTIGNTYFSMGRYKEAVEHLRRGLELRGVSYLDLADPWGREYAETTFAMKRLGLALQALGQPDQAKPLFLRSGEARRRVEIRRIPFSVNVFPFTLHPLKVIFSPDGRWLLASGDDDLLRLYDVASGVEIHRFVGYIAAWGLAFSPDGRHALSSHNDNTVRLLDVFAAKELRRFIGHTDFVASVAFSPNGQRALSASHDKTIRLWDVQSGKEIRQFLGHTDLIHNAVFSPDGSRIVSASEDATIRFWDVETGAEIRTIRTFEKRGATVCHVAFSPDGRQILSTDPGPLRLWNVENGEEVRQIPCGGGGTAVFTPDGHHAVSSGDQRGKWFLYDLDTGTVVRTYHLDWPLRPKAIEVSRDGRLAVCGNFRGSISIWRMDDPPPMRQELAAARQNYDQKRRDLGPDAPETLQALDELAALHLDREEPTDAEPLFRQSLERNLRLYDPEHPAALAARKNLARTLQEQKKLAEAAALYRQCLEVYRQAQGADHPDVLVASNDLADVLEAQGKPDEAGVLWQQCGQSWERLMGRNKPHARAAAHKLIVNLRSHGKVLEPRWRSLAIGLVYAEMGQWDEAVACYAKCFEAAVPKDRELYWEYACLLVQQRDDDGYRKLCADMLKSFAESKDEVDIHVLLFTCALAPRADADNGRIAELVEERMARMRRGNLPDDWRHVLALSCYRAGHYQQAVDLLSAVLKAQVNEWQDVANWLVMSLAEQRLGHAEKAQEWLAKADQWVQEETRKLATQPEPFSNPMLSFVHWFDWLRIEILHREAKARIRGEKEETKEQKTPGARSW